MISFIFLFTNQQTFAVSYVSYTTIVIFIDAQTRTHNCGLQPETQIGQCNTIPGVYFPWGNWGACSASCQGGQRVRTRRHNCGLPDDVEPEVRQSLISAYF